jgi:UPF0042 nucleotide-binding protein
MVAARAEPTRQEAAVARSRAELVIVTGLSGSGKSTVAKCFEDLGYYVVDNLPLPLLRELLQAPLQLVGDEQRNIAVVTDVRARGFAAELPTIFRTLDRTQVNPTLLFLEASDESLVRRFSETRRPHPLSSDLPVAEAIQRERQMLAELRGLADLVFDTTQWNVHEIRSKVYHAFSTHAQGGTEMVVSLVSFGFKYGVPSGSDLLFDVRFLPNPHFVPELRPLTGRDEAVMRYLEQQPDYVELVDRLSELLLYLLPRYKKENRSYLSVAVGCTGGRHRSVAIVESLGRRLQQDGWEPRLRHRDIDR